MSRVNKIETDASVRVAGRNPRFGVERVLSYTSETGFATFTYSQREKDWRWHIPVPLISKSESVKSSDPSNAYLHALTVSVLKHSWIDNKFHLRIPIIRIFQFHSLRNVSFTDDNLSSSLKLAWSF